MNLFEIVSIKQTHGHVKGCSFVDIYAVDGRSLREEEQQTVEVAFRGGQHERGPANKSQSTFQYSCFIIINATSSLVFVISFGLLKAEKVPMSLALLFYNFYQN